MISIQGDVPLNAGGSFWTFRCLLPVIVMVFCWTVSGTAQAGERQCDPQWHTARLTHYESYPVPGSAECVDYNGCAWAGQFYGLEGKRSESWVAWHNIVAVHMKDWPLLGMKVLRLRQGARTIDVRVLDACSDADCDGCCTANLGGDGYLIDIEKYTMQRFGAGDGLVDFQVCR
ncbi:hypothetical protein HH303_07005 [Rhodospirillaceae bacterium KN72]|uniref:RlpA-like protein double-psi beta-barrel domain-containing protein n=1 Tax=Pacificispira spongiicola TaxID=2729598 RepID=A0A7Y0DZ15_9PROT|nr:hypothetical protein [Pacificispira spongiicola]NMM44219.1 hypothetical protein [Pacificispira spongiicola]